MSLGGTPISPSLKDTDIAVYDYYDVVNSNWYWSPLLGTSDEVLKFDAPGPLVSIQQAYEVRHLTRSCSGLDRLGTSWSRLHCY